MPAPPFSPAEWTLTDLRRTVASLRVRFAWIVQGCDDVDGVDALATELAALVATTPADAVRADLELAVERGEAILRAAAALVAASGTGADPGGPGEVVGLFRSDGGVPKTAIDVAVVGHRGVEGDRQGTRRHHGRVWQALCLWSAEVIARLQADGHPIAPGRAGENVTVAGLDWAALRPGQRLGIGEVEAELSAYALPCAQNAAWFVGGDFTVMDPVRHPGTSRLYASVLRPGTVRLGDAVTLLR